jgi:uncharacterized UPF0160 family protein
MKVITHSGAFTPDQICAISIFYLKDDCLDLERTRDTSLVERNREDKRVYLVDIGHRFEPDLNNYDHSEGQERPCGGKYATTGLVWQTIGRQTIRATLIDYAKDNLADDVVDEIFSYIDNYLVMGIDAWDNGDYKINGSVKMPVLPAVISSFNPISGHEDTGDSGFFDAMWLTIEFVASYIERQIKQSYAFCNNRRIIKDALHQSENGIVVLDRGVKGWASQLMNIDKSMEAKFCVFPSFEGSWMVHAVPEKFGSRRSRVRFPKSWAGKNGGDLEKVAGVDGSIFCNKGMYIAGNKTRSGAIEMARRANGSHS